MNGFIKALTLCTTFALGAAGLSASDDAEAGPFRPRGRVAELPRTGFGKPARPVEKPGFFRKAWESITGSEPETKRVPHPGHRVQNNGENAGNHGTPDGCGKDPGFFESLLGETTKPCPSDNQPKTGNTKTSPIYWPR